MGDLQLAIAITRAYEGDDGPVLKGILEERVLPDAAADGNRWMASWAFWMLGRRDMAVRSLIVSPSMSTFFSLATKLTNPVSHRITYYSLLRRTSPFTGQIIPLQRPSSGRPLQTTP